MSLHPKYEINLLIYSSSLHERIEIFVVHKFTTGRSIIGNECMIGKVEISSDDFTLNIVLKSSIGFLYFLL